MPRWSSTSIVRECRPPARELSTSWPARRSTIATSTPASASSPANISPVGPPPAITTGCPLVNSVPPSVEAQDRFLDLLTVAGCEAAVDANASEPSLLQHSKRSDVVRGRAGVHRSFGSLCKNNL